MNAKIAELRQMAEERRKRLHEMIDRQYDEFINMLETGHPVKSTERVPMYLINNSIFFKGEKPEEIIFSDDRSVPVKTWREAAAVLLVDCNNEMHDKLAYLVGRVFGRQRAILAENPDKMNVPIKVDSGIYFEGFFSTETLLDVLKKNIFDAVGYDYSGIRIRLRKSENTI